jgi:hypothetical protein
MNGLVEEIGRLSRAEALEALGYLADALQVSDEPDLPRADLLGDWEEHPYEHLSEMEELARILLQCAALTPEIEGAARTAVAGVGRKQLVLGGLELVALAILALGVAQVLVSKGREREEVLEIEEEENGRKRRLTWRGTSFGISKELANVLRAAGGRPPAPPIAPSSEPALPE